MLTKYSWPVLNFHTLQQAFRLMEFVVQVVHNSTISFIKWTNNTNVCTCLTGYIQGLKVKFKAKCAGNLRFLVGRLAAKVSLPSGSTAAMPHYSHNAKALAYNSLN